MKYLFLLGIYETVDKDSEEFYHLILFLTRFYEVI